MLVKQSQVLTNLAILDEEEAARAESAGLRWQVSSFSSHLFSHNLLPPLLSSAAPAEAFLL